MLVGILGMGSIGDRHALNLMRLGHQVIYHDPVREGSLPREEVIAAADAVLICTPTKQHVADLMHVLQAGKHVFVEKPIGYDCPPFISGLIMGARPRRPDLVVAVGFMLRFHPKVIATKKIIEGRKITGAGFQVRQRNSKPEYLRDGVIRNWLSHELDLARYLLGNLEVLECSGDEAVAGISLKTEQNGGVWVCGDYLTLPEERGFIITFDGYDDLEVDLTLPEWNDVYLDEMRAFISACEGGDAGPLADGADGVANLMLIMQAREKAGLND